MLVDGKRVPGDRAFQRAKLGQQRMLEPLGRQIRFFARFAQQFAGQQPLGRLLIERVDRLCIAAQENRHAAAPRGIVGQLAPDILGERFGVEQANDVVLGERFLEQVVERDGVAVKRFRAFEPQGVGGNRLAQEQRVVFGRLGRGQEHLPGGCHVDGEPARVVGGQRVFAGNPHVTLMQPRFEPAQAKLGLGQSAVELDRRLAALVGRL